MAGVKYDGDLNDTKLQEIHLGIRTPHNIHLQIIFDLGFAGAALFSNELHLAGLALVLIR